MAGGLRIPVAAAQRIADQYGYDQVMIYARKTGDGGREHMATYGVNRVHCKIAAAMAARLQAVMGWQVSPQKVNDADLSRDAA